MAQRKAAKAPMQDGWGDERARFFNPPIRLAPAMLWRTRCMGALRFFLLPLTFDTIVHSTLRRLASRVHLLWSAKNHRLLAGVGSGTPFARLMLAEVKLTRGEKPLAARLSLQ